jgi:hypothetical protein
MSEERKSVFATDSLTVEHLRVSIDNDSRALTLTSDHIEEKMKTLPQPQELAKPEPIPDDKPQSKKDG